MNISDIGTLLRKRRVQLGLSQTELAARLGMSRTHLSLIEHGHKLPHIKLVAALADALGIEIGIVGVLKKVQ